MSTQKLVHEYSLIAVLFINNNPKVETTQIPIN